MIIDSVVTCNGYKEKILDFYGFWKYICPNCHAKNSFIRHAKYLRWICFLNNDEFEEMSLEVLRLYCKSCKTTHAILPAGTIPYCFYSGTCVLIVLKKYFVEESNSLNIANKFNISQQLIYHLIIKYLSCLDSCINFLRAFLQIDIAYNCNKSRPLFIIDANFIDLDFLKKYFYHTDKIFSMTRRRNILSNKLHIGMYEFTIQNAHITIE